MSDIPTSPELPVRDKGIVTTRKEFSDALTADLTDDEIAKAFSVMVPIISKWQERFRRRAHLYSTPEAALVDLDRFEDELKTELREKLSLYATVDCTPVFEGESPIVEFAGVAREHSIHQHGMDHEKKTWEVQKATAKDEDYLHAKGKPLRRRENHGPTRPDRKPASS